MAPSQVSSKNPYTAFLYYSNLIGYARILIAGLAFYLQERPLWFLVLYTITCSLDSVDGAVARKLNQCTLKPHTCP